MSRRARAIILIKNIFYIIGLVYCLILFIIYLVRPDVVLNYFFNFLGGWFFFVLFFIFWLIKFVILRVMILGKWVFFVFKAGYFLLLDIINGSVDIDVLLTRSKFLLNVFSSIIFFLFKATYFLMAWLIESTRKVINWLIESTPKVINWLIESTPKVINWLIESTPKVINWLFELLLRSVNWLLELPARSVNWLLEVMSRSTNWLLQGTDVWIERLSEAWFYSRIWLFEGWLLGCSFKNGIIKLINTLGIVIEPYVTIFIRFWVVIIQNYLYYERISKVFYEFLCAPTGFMFLIERDILPKAWILIWMILFYCFLRYRRYKRMTWGFDSGPDEDEPLPTEHTFISWEGEDYHFSVSLEKHFEENFRVWFTKKDFMYLVLKEYGRRAIIQAKKEAIISAKWKRARILVTRRKKAREEERLQKLVLDSKFTLFLKKYKVKLKKLVLESKFTLFLKKYKVKLKEMIGNAKFTLFLKKYKVKLKEYVKKIILFIIQLVKAPFKLTVGKIYQYIVAKQNAKKAALLDKSFKRFYTYVEDDDDEWERRLDILIKVEQNKLASKEAKEAAWLEQFRKEMREFRVELKIEKWKNDQAFKKQQEWIKRFFD